MRTATTASLLLLGAMTGCTPEPPPARPDAAIDAGLAFLPERHTDFVLAVTRDLPDGGFAVVFQGSPAPDAGPGEAPPAPAAAPLLSAEALLPDGSALPLSRDGVTSVEPSARFRVEVAARLTDARLSLLDAQDAMVASDGTVEATATTRFTLAPAAPLRPGSSYTLRLDGAEGRLLVAENGGRYQPVSLPLRTSGATPAPQGKAKARRRR